MSDEEILSALRAKDPAVCLEAAELIESLKAEVDSIRSIEEAHRERCDEYARENRALLKKIAKIKEAANG